MKSRNLAAALCCLGGSLFATASMAQQIYSNGPFITNPGAHVPSGDVSLAQDVTYPGYTMLGMNAGPNFRLADDFFVPAGHIWTVNSATLYAYQFGSDGADFTDARVIIWIGQPDGFASIKVFDGTAENLLVSTTPVAYRSAQSFSAPYSNSDRRIVAISIALPDLELSGGQYWLDWQLKGPDPGTSVFTPPVSILGQPYTSVDGFARKKCPATVEDPNDSCATSPGQWQLFENGTAPYLVDLPFVINGVDIENVIFNDGFDTPDPTP
ncbi:hypothetical protein [Dokdonella sp.]|uniref:hypothetical protein n=1 Tax=Dokdonella sp. TaxID=2291710 RepID=UPI003C513C3F